VDGWAGKILRVDLSSGQCTTEELAASDARAFLGGRALAVRLFTREVDPGVDAFSADNKLVIAAGTLTGSGAPSAAMATAVSKSPLTGGITYADLPGHLGPEIKFCGYDALIIEGRAAAPCYLSILDGRARLLSAGHLWGESTDRVDVLVREEWEDHWKARELHILSIGPAGERQANLATLASRGRLALGGAGLGAVMGGKQLKAIALRGTRGVSVAQGTSFFDLVTDIVAALRQAGGLSQRLTEAGTTIFLEAAAALGALPVNNFSGLPFANLAALGESSLVKQLAGHRSCFACPIGCMRRTCVAVNGFRGCGEGPGYDSLTMLGTNCGVDNLAAISASGYACRTLGLDPISTGATIALAMELFGEGLIGAEELAGAATFGDGAAVLRLCRLIGLGRDMGCVLGNGAHNLAAYCERPDLFVGVKGREMPPVDARASQGMGLHLATSNCGPYHLSGPWGEELLSTPEAAHATEGKAARVCEAQDWRAAASSLGICQIALMGLDREQFLPLLAAATGRDFAAGDIPAAGERAINLERAFNIAAGISGEDDILPERLRQPVPEGPAAGESCDLARLLPEYYRLRGWTPEGQPTAEKLSSLGLE
jgi:aldehyde:ferredoxin oxidoreductase